MSRARDILDNPHKVLSVELAGALLSARIYKQARGRGRDYIWVRSDVSGVGGDQEDRQLMIHAYLPTRIDILLPRRKPVSIRIIRYTTPLHLLHYGRRV